MGTAIGKRAGKEATKHQILFRETRKCFGEIIGVLKSMEEESIQCRKLLEAGLVGRKTKATVCKMQKWASDLETYYHVALEYLEEELAAVAKDFPEELIELIVSIQKGITELLAGLGPLNSKIKSLAAEPGVYSAKEIEMQIKEAIEKFKRFLGQSDIEKQILRKEEEMVRQYLANQYMREYESAFIAKLIEEVKEIITFQPTLNFQPNITEESPVSFKGIKIPTLWIRISFRYPQSSYPVDVSYDCEDDKFIAKENVGDFKVEDYDFMHLAKKLAAQLDRKYKWSGRSAVHAA